VVTRFGDPTAPLLVTRSLLYADDTLIVEADAEIAQYYMEAIAEVGAQYGMSYNWTKLEVLRVRHDGHIIQAAGSRVKEKDAIVYLGSLLSADGSMAPELSRRLGMAMADFEALQRVWRHASIAKARKMTIFKACVLQRLLYCLDTTWLTASALRKLDGFQARCLRKILGIQHAYWSHVSNASVLQQAQEWPLSVVLKHRQLKLFGRIARMSNTSPLRQVTFESSSVEAKVWPGTKRRGRPRDAWAPCVRAFALQAAGGETELAGMLVNTADAAARWSSAIRKYCFPEGKQAAIGRE